MLKSLLLIHKRVFQFGNLCDKMKVTEIGGHKPKERSSMAKRRSNGDGSVRKLESGKWQIQIMDGYKPDGTRKIKSFSATKLDEAKRLKREYEQRRDAGMLAAMDYSFAEWADFWFEHHKNMISATTQEGYSYTLRNLKNHFGRRKLTAIKAYDIEQYLMKLIRDGRSSSTVAQSRGMLFQIFKMAVANDILMKNPVAHAEKIRRAPPKPKEAYTADEVRKLMKELPDDKIGWSIRLLLGTGMRTQELLALEPRHIAKDGSSINVAQAVVMEGGKPKIGPTKTHTSTRTIPVPEMVRYCARNLRDTDKRFIWEGGRTGMPCNPSHFRSQFKETVGAIEDVRVLTPHCCRHTYVSQMLALGVDPKTIQAMVGHAEIDMTMYYAHAQESSKQAAISRYDEAFSAEGGGLYGNILTFVKSG